MSDEAATETPKRRGRPPGKKAKRHDPEEAPIDGNEGCDIVNGKDPDFEYFLAEQAEDRFKLEGRGAVVCSRENETARPFYDRRANAGESAIIVKDLVLMKMPKKQFQAQQANHLARAKQRTVALKRDATGNVGSGLSTINTNFEDGGYRRQVI